MSCAASGLERFAARVHPKKSSDQGNPVILGVPTSQEVVRLSPTTCSASLGRSAPRRGGEISPGCFTGGPDAVRVSQDVDAANPRNLDRLVDGGTSVIVIEHSQAVMAHADWIIDLGPGAGHDGGRIVFEGTPADLVAGRAGLDSLTGEHLAAYVEA